MKKLFFLLVVLLLCVFSMSLAEEAATVTIEKKQYDATLAELDLTKVKISSVDKLEDALSQMPNLTYVDLSYSGLANDVLADMRTRWAEKGIKIVWTLKFCGYECRTDATAFSTLHDTYSTRYGEDKYYVLQYATELQALDLGHNWMFDISWMEPLKNLKVVILSDNRITDISVFEGMDLEYLEMFNNRVNDISVLAGMENLMDVNLCHTHVSDLSPLENLPNLQRVWMGNISELTKDEINRFLAVKGEALEAYNFTTEYPTEGGWRIHDRYEIIKSMFHHGIYISFDTPLDQIERIYLRKDHTY